MTTTNKSLRKSPFSSLSLKPFLSLSKFPFIIPPEFDYHSSKNPLFFSLSLSTKSHCHGSANPHLRDLPLNLPSLAGHSSDLHLRSEQKRTKLSKPRTKMKIPCCSVCQTRYNEEERVPLLLQCGHGFCKECLSKMFSASPDTTLPCPRCRHVSLVGNSVHALRKNFAVLALAAEARGSSDDVDYTDDDEEEEDDDEDEDDDSAAAARRRGSGRGAGASGSGCGPVIEVGAHPEVRLVRRIGEARRAGVEMWAASIGGGGGRCRHAVAVKKVAVAVAEEEVEGGVEWVLGKLEGLRRASMWCRNVCTFHGVARMEGSLCLVMERCYGSVQSEMQRNEGRLTLEQILRL